MLRSHGLKKLSLPTTALVLLLCGSSHAGHMADVLKDGLDSRRPSQQGPVQGSSEARSAGRAIQMTPDTYDCLARDQACGTLLFQADIGKERWSINGDIASDILTGNVFYEDLRAPVFLWCPIVGAEGSAPTGAFVLHCFAAASCAGGPCLQRQWEDLGSVTLPMSYIVP